MKTEKLSLKGIKNVLSRAEMKKILAGSGSCVPLGQTNCNIPTTPCCSGLWCYTLTGTCESGYIYP
jgi:hypothetical protein